MRAAMLAALVVLPAAVGDRCSPQLLQSIDPAKNITVYNRTANATQEVPEGIKPIPAMPGSGPFFTSVLDSGQLCFTGAASGRIRPMDTCRCSRNLRALEDKIAEAQKNPSAGDDAYIQLLGDAAAAAAGAACIERETTEDPPYLFPSVRDINLTQMPHVNVRGRICEEPAIDVTNEARAEKLVAPWEFMNIQGDTAACNCPRGTEYFSENFAPNDPATLAYSKHMVDKLPPFDAGADLPTSGDVDYGTCNVNRAGWGWVGQNAPGLTISGAGEAVLTVNATETEVPITPGNPEKASCGGLMDPEERINFCLYGLAESTEPLPIVPGSVNELAAFCSAPLTAAARGSDKYTKCCMTAEIQNRGQNKTVPKSMVRRDMMVALQCRQSMYALNSGTGRFHTVPTSPFLDDSDRISAATRSVGGYETNFMPDVLPETLANLRNTFFDAGFSDVCIPGGVDTEPVCHAFTKFDLTEDDNVKDAGIYQDAPKCSSGANNAFSEGGSSQSSFWAQTVPGQLLSLRRAAAPWNTCIMPSTMASTGLPTKLSPCEAAKHFNLFPQLYTNSSKGWTAADFETCTIDDVPSIVQGWYAAAAPENSNPKASDMLKWWGSQPPSFYLGGASFPAPIADYFTQPSQHCLQNIPGRGDSTNGFQGPSTGGLSPPDPSATCSSEGCCLPGHEPKHPEDLTSVCCEDQSSCTCFTGTEEMERVQSKMGTPEIQKTIQDCLSGTNKFVWGDEAQEDDSRFCVFAGQYVTERQYLWKENVNNTRPFKLFPDASSFTKCEDAQSNRIRIVGDEIIFVSTAPRLGGKPIHPIFQTANYVGGALQTTNFNYTRSQWGPSQAYRAGDLNRSIFYADGQKAGSFDLPDTTPEDPASRTITYDGIELALIGCADCFLKNHRGAVNMKDGSTEIKIPSLFPRWVDVQQGGPPACPDVGSCLTFDNNGQTPNVVSGEPSAGVPISNWATHGDRYGIDLYNWGGGIAPFSTEQAEAGLAGGFIQAHTVGYYGGVGDSDEDYLPLLATLGNCVIDSPDRCNGKCDMTKFAENVATDAVKGLVGIALLAIPGAEEVGVAEIGADAASVGTGAAEGVADEAENAVSDAGNIQQTSSGSDAEDGDGSPPPPPPQTAAPKNRKVKVKIKRTALSRLKQHKDVVGGTLTGSSISDSITLAAEAKTVMKGNSVYDIASETTGTLAIKTNWKDLFNGVLKTNPPQGRDTDFVFLTGKTNFDSPEKLLEFYKNYPTMLRACLYENRNEPNRCVGEPYTDSTENPKTGGFTSKSGIKLGPDSLASAGEAWDATVDDTGPFGDGNFADCDTNNMGVGVDGAATRTSWWAGRTSMLETTPLGVQIACHVAAAGPDKRAGSGRFKLTGKFVQPVRLDFRQFVYDAPNAAAKNENVKPSITFTTVEEENISPLFGDKMYTVTRSDNTPLDMMATFGPIGLCGLCGNIGAAADTSPVRRACTMGTDNKKVRYDIQDSLGVFDIHANAWFREHGLYNKSVLTDMVKFTYFDVIGTTSDTGTVANFTDTATATSFSGNSTIERLLGVNLDQSSGDAYKEATTTPPCIGDIQAAVVPYCEIDTRLFHRAVKDSPPCSGENSTYKTTCPNPRWSNDFRVTFPKEVPEKAVPPPSAYDFDDRAEKLSYCASGPWDFSDPNWYLQPPSGTEVAGDPRAPLPYPPSLFNTSLKTFVRCDSDLKTPEERRNFCTGDKTNLVQQGYITTFGFRAGVHTKIGDVCHRTGGRNVQCIVYANQTVGNFKTIQSVIDAFPDTDATAIEIFAVPVSATVVAEALLMFMTDVSTLYYNDPSDPRLGPDAYNPSTDTNHGSILGQKMGIDYDLSAALFPGLCHARPSTTFFSVLYAAIEHFRHHHKPDSFEFVNFDGLTGAARRGLHMTDDEVYPTHVESRINFGSRQVTVQSAFSATVAASATAILRSGVFKGNYTATTLPVRHFRIGGMVDPTHGCTRFLVQQANATILGIEFRQGGICTRLAPESERVPVVAGGQRVVDLRIGSCVCVDCVAGILSARGGDPQLGTDEVGANVDVEGAIVFDTRYLLSDQNAIPAINTDGTCDPTTRLSDCQNASLPGVEAAFARIVGNPVIRSCPTERGDGDLRLVSEYCDVVMKYPPITVREGQFPGGPIASNQSSDPIRDTGCSSVCPEAQFQYDTLYGSAELLPCCDGRTDEVFYTCPQTLQTIATRRNIEETNYTRTSATVNDTCSYRNCLWNRMTNPDARPQWIDIEAPNALGTGVVVDPSLCRTFFRMCAPGSCPITEDTCATCAANKTFWPLCAPENTLSGLLNTTVLQQNIDLATLPYPEVAKNFLHSSNVIKPPCAEFGYAVFTDGHVVANETDRTQFTDDVLRTLTAENSAGQLCSILGCPNAVSHATVGSSSLLSVGLPICMNRVNNINQNPLHLRQVWTVHATVDGLGPPPLGEPVAITSAGLPSTTVLHAFELQAATFTAPGVADPAFFILDTYGTLGESGVFTAQIAVAEATTTDLAAIVSCVSRQATTTATGTEAGGPLEIRPCSATDPFQAFEFVLHRQLNRWRIQVPADPFLCLTLQTTSPTACSDGEHIGNSSTRKCPTTISKTTVPAGAVPVVLPCFPCSVGVDTTGTGSGPVVSSVLTLPSISIGDFRGLPEGRNFNNTRQIPLSTNDPSLALTVDLDTGLCFRLAPTLAAGGIFGPTETTGTQAVDQVPCSLLEGAPIAQLEAVGGPDVCTHAAGLLVAACDAATGSLVLVDGTSDQVKALCTALGSNTVEVVGASGGRGAFVNCTFLQGGTEYLAASSYTRSLEVVVGGAGYRDNDVLRAADPNSTAGAAFDGVAGTFHGFIAKAVWQPSESSESVASSPVVGPTIEVLNVSRIFDIFGEDRLFTIFAASVSSATAAYVVFGIECAIIFTAVVYHLVVFYGGGKRGAGGR